LRELFCFIKISLGLCARVWPSDFWGWGSRFRTSGHVPAAAQSISRNRSDTNHARHQHTCWAPLKPVRCWVRYPVASDQLSRHYYDTDGSLRSLLSDVIAGRDVLEYCPSGLGDTHEATAVHYVFRRDGRRQYTDVVAYRAGATAGDAASGALPSSAKPDNPANGLDPLLQQAQTLGAPMAAVARAITISRRCAGKVPQMAPPSAPEAFERSSAQLRVSGGVLDVGMAQPKLQRRVSWPASAKRCPQV
jgi:hypothetical protein